MIDYILSRLNWSSLETKGLTSNNLLERSKHDYTYVKGSDTLLVVLPGWGQQLYSWKRVRNYALNTGCSFLAYEFPREILSDNKDLTKECFLRIDSKVRSDIERLKAEYGFKRCVLVAVSLASSFGSIIYKDNERVNEIVLIVPGENLARDMWHGCRTQHLRNSYQHKDISLDTLTDEWKDLASENNLPHDNTRISLFYGAKDKVIPYNLGKSLIPLLQSFKLSTRILPMGHYLVIFKFLLFPKYFLQRSIASKLGGTSGFVSIQNTAL